MSTITYPHVEINSEGVAMLSGATTKVIEIVQDHQAHHCHAEDICRQFPYLSLAQVHAALAYYYDHEQEMEQDIDRRRRRVADIKAKRGDGVPRSIDRRTLLSSRRPSLGRRTCSQPR